MADVEYKIGKGKKCKLENCSRQSKLAMGVCYLHYKRFIRTGHFLKLWGKGRKLTEEHKRKLSQVQLGRKGYNWKGNSVGYSALHKWIIKMRGKIKECCFCGIEGKTEWASISHKAKRDLNDFIPLCVKCHRNYDRNGLTP